MVFYDPLFPEVCKLCMSPLCIGVSTNVAFKLSGLAAVRPFLEKLAPPLASLRLQGNAYESPQWQDFLKNKWQLTALHFLLQIVASASSSSLPLCVCIYIV